MNDKDLILVVDDEPDTVRLAKRLLEMAGLKVSTAYDGEEALKKIYDESPALILLDIKLPKIDGYEVCRKIKSDPKYKDTIIVMFTAKVFEKDKKKGAEVGANEYITKPFSGDELVSVIKKLLKEEKP
ncbi:MAG: response regulator transcription factor [Candidatus Helarchaeota archaeon]